MIKIKHFTLFAIVLIAFTFPACEAIDIVDGTANETIQLRVQNISQQDIEEVTVQEINYGNIEAGKTTEYETLKHFNQCGGTITEYIVAKAGEIDYANPYSGMIICGIGIDYGLDGGKYTLTLDLEKVTEAGDGSNDLIINIVKD